MRATNQFLRSRLYGSRFEVAEVGCGQRFVDLKCPWLAICVNAIPIEEAKRRVAVLLNLDQQIAGADCMQASARDKDGVTGVHAQAIHELESPAIADRALELRTLNSTLQTKTNRAARNGR